MSDCSSIRTFSSSGDGNNSDYHNTCVGTEVIILNGCAKFRDGKKWKNRFCLLTKLSPAADCLQLQIYRDEKERARNGHTKASLSIKDIYAIESGFTFDKESHTLCIICMDLNVILAFENRERLICWSVKITRNLGPTHQFLVQISNVPSKSKLSPGTAKLHISDNRFCLTASMPPKLLAVWEISQLRKYGIVEGRFIFEGGSRCGKGAGVHVLIPEISQAPLLLKMLEMSSQGQLKASYFKEKPPTTHFHYPKKSELNKFSIAHCHSMSKVSSSHDSLDSINNKLTSEKSEFVQSRPGSCEPQCFSPLQKNNEAQNENNSLIKAQNLTTQPIVQNQNLNKDSISSITKEKNKNELLCPSWTMDLSSEIESDGNEAKIIFKDKDYTYDTPNGCNENISINLRDQNSLVQRSTYDHYDFPREGSVASSNSTSKISKNERDRQSVASSDPDWYDVPKGHNGTKSTSSNNSYYDIPSNELRPVDISDRKNLEKNIIGSSSSENSKISDLSVNHQNLASNTPTQAIYAQIDKSKKLPKANKNHEKNQPLYENTHDTKVIDSSYANSTFVNSLNFYENSVEVQSSKLNEMSISNSSQNFAKRDEKVKEMPIYENETSDIVTLESCSGVRNEISDGKIPKRSSSVSCKLGNVKRNSGSSCDSGVSGDGAIYSEDANDKGSLQKTSKNEKSPKSSNFSKAKSEDHDYKNTNEYEDLDSKLGINKRESHTYSEIGEKSPAHYETIDEANKSRIGKKPRSGTEYINRLVFSQK